MIDSGKSSFIIFHNLSVLALHQSIRIKSLRTRNSKILATAYISFSYERCDNKKEPWDFDSGVKEMIKAIRVDCCKKPVSLAYSQTCID